MMESFPLDNGSDMTNHQGSCTHAPVEKNTTPVVTTAEVSSEETTTADSPEQPQAVTVASQSKASLSTVHVQQSFHGHRTSIPVLTHSASEPHYPKRKTLVRSPAVVSVPSPPPPSYPEEIAEGTPPYKNTSFDSSDSGIAGELPPRLEAQARASRQSSLSRDGSFEYTDSTGTDLHEFIIKTLRNPRDRKFLMRLEQDLLNFIQEPAMYIQYPPMTSYHRMIVHRVAAYFGMDHNVDQQTGKSVIINKTLNTRIPESRFLELLPREESEDSESAVPRLILRRQNTPDDNIPPKIESPVLMHHTMEDKRSKSIEEREEEYHKVRERIFNQDSLSSQSSQSSKGDVDAVPPQLLQKEDDTVEVEDVAPEEKDSEWTSNNKISKSKSFDVDSSADKGSGASTSGIRIMTNRPFTRSSSSPGTVSNTSAVERISSSSRRGSDGNPRVSQRHAANTQTVVSAVPYWAEGVPFVTPSLPTGELQMVPVQSAAPGMQGMVPVMAPSQSGGMMWSLPREPVQHGVMLIHPNTGTPVLGGDGNPLVMQPAYQQVMLKPGGGPSYSQQTTAAAPSQVQASQQQLSGLGPQQQQQQQQPTAQSPGQIVMPGYVSFPQQVYMMPPSGRPPYASQQQPQGAEGVPGSHWSAAGQTSANPGYHEVATQFGALSLSGQQTSLDSPAFPQQQQQQYSESGIQGSTRTTSPMYVNSVTQPGMTSQVQYVVLPHAGMHPQMRQVMQGQTLVGQAATSSQQYQGYMVSPGQSPYQHYPYGAVPKDVTPSVIQHHSRSQTPPTPPQTASPILSSQFMQPQPQQQLTFSSQISPQSSMTHPQQTHTPPYQQQTPHPHPSQQVLRPVVPVVIPGGRGVAMGQQGSLPPQYQQAAVHVHTQYPPNQKRVHNMDRRVPKTGDLYSSEAAAQGPHSLTSFNDGTVPVGYEAQGDRGQYSQYQQQRYPLVNSSTPQYQSYNKQKSKQHKERRASPRGQPQDTSKKHGRKTPESENS